MVTFRKPIGSVSVSGHKFVGAPVPCGVVITRKRYAMALSSDVEYLNSRDATIMVRSNRACGSACQPMLRPPSIDHATQRSMCRGCDGRQSVQVAP